LVNFIKSSPAQTKNPPAELQSPLTENILATVLMGQNPNKGEEGSKMGRAEAIQTDVVYFPRYHCLSFSVA